MYHTSPNSLAGRLSNHSDARSGGRAWPCQDHRSGFGLYLSACWAPIPLNAASLTWLGVVETASVPSNVGVQIDSFWGECAAWPQATELFDAHWKPIPKCYLHREFSGRGARVEADHRRHRIVSR